MVTLDMNNFLFLVEVFLAIQCCESAKYCQEAVDSVKKVKSCPTSKAERDKAARMKNCEGKALRQNCSKVDQFEYHCVINGYRNITLEVCAPTRIIFGHCVEFNVAGGVIQDQFSAPCDEHFPKCDAFYLSSTAYKYSDCYDLVLKRDIYQSTTTKDSSNANIDVWKTDITYPLIAPIGFTAIVTFIIIVAAVVSNRRRQNQTEWSKKTEFEDDNATQGKQMESTNTSEKNERSLPEKNDIEQGTPSSRATTDKRHLKRRSSFCITILNSMETMTPFLRRSFSIGSTKDIEKTRSQYVRVGIPKAIKNIFYWTRQPSLKPIFYFGDKIGSEENSDQQLQNKPCLSSERRNDDSEVSQESHSLLEQVYDQNTLDFSKVKRRQHSSERM